MVKSDGTAPVYECYICKDQGGYFVDGIDSWGNTVPVWHHPCECAERKRSNSLLKSSHMSERLRACGFKNFVSEGRPQAVIDALECAKDYYRNFESIRNSRNPGICLLGKPGSGKTHLLAAIANCLLHDKVQVLYFPHEEGMSDLTEDFDKLHEKLDAMKNTQVLFWDDLFIGSEKPTPFQLKKLFEVVNFRYLNNLPLLLSSEKTIDELIAIHEGIGSRVYEMCKNHTVTMGLTAEEKTQGMQLNYRLMR